MNINTLQQLTIPIYLPVTNKEIKKIFDVLSEKKSITKLEVEFKLDPQTESYGSMHFEETKIMKTIFYKQVLPAIRNMLRLHWTIKFLRINCRYLKESKQTDESPIQNLFYNTPFHSLELLEIHRSSQKIKQSITTYSKHEYSSGKLYEVKMHIYNNYT